FHLAHRALVSLPPLLGGESASLSPMMVAILATALFGVIGLVFAYFINVNHASQHRLYRDRLMEVFCAEEGALTSGQWLGANLAQKSEGWLMNMTKVKRPLHLINTALITTDSSDRKYRGRGGDNFLL